jgi:hypothetical protein
MILVLSSNESMSQTSKVSSENNIKTQKVDTPIKAKGKTDPNYERNLTKSKAYVAFVRKEQIAPVKNKSYYENLIQKLKTEIAEREKIADPKDEIATGKIIRIKDDLFIAEENLKKITQEK